VHLNVNGVINIICIIFWNIFNFCLFGWEQDGRDRGNENFRNKAPL
jgi:hypothetical protein